MRNREKTFHGKILLFGEYSLIHGSKALTIPFAHYNATLLFPDTAMDNKAKRTAVNSNQQLLAYHQFLLELESEPLIRGEIDLEAFAEDISHGLYLASDIPSGFGLGSSGALVAAIYFQYARKPLTAADKITHHHLAELKLIFSHMEAFFHGTSSGIDPLSAFVGRPLIIGQDQTVSVATFAPANNNGKGDGGFFLINTRIPRKTSSLIAIFQKKLRHKAFRETFHQEYIACNDACIDAILSGDHGLNQTLGRLSRLQLDLFHEMVPEAFRSMWIEGLTSGQYSLKLCGAGGGGFLLGFTDSYPGVSAVIQAHNVSLTPLRVR